MGRGQGITQALFAATFDSGRHGTKVKRFSNFTPRRDWDNQKLIELMAKDEEISAASQINIWDYSENLRAMLYDLPNSIAEELSFTEVTANDPRHLMPPFKGGRLRIWSPKTGQEIFIMVPDATLDQVRSDSPEASFALGLDKERLPWWQLQARLVKHFLGKT